MPLSSPRLDQAFRTYRRRSGRQDRNDVAHSKNARVNGRLAFVKLPRAIDLEEVEVLAWREPQVNGTTWSAASLGEAVGFPTGEFAEDEAVVYDRKWPVKRNLRPFAKGRRPEDAPGHQRRAGGQVPQRLQHFRLIPHRVIGTSADTRQGVCAAKPERHGMGSPAALWVEALDILRVYQLLVAPPRRIGDVDVHGEVVHELLRHLVQVVQVSVEDEACCLKLPRRLSVYHRLCYWQEVPFPLLSLFFQSLPPFPLVLPVLKQLFLASKGAVGVLIHVLRLPVAPKQLPLPLPRMVLCVREDDAFRLHPHRGAGESRQEVARLQAEHLERLALLIRLGVLLEPAVELFEVDLTIIIGVNLVEKVPRGVLGRGDGKGSKQSLHLLQIDRLGSVRVEGVENAAHAFAVFEGLDLGRVQSFLFVPLHVVRHGLFARLCGSLLDLRLRH
eukprot:scaffold2368_cov248-Pinguiococcus_pyrenoidosus.AAC.2